MIIPEYWAEARVQYRGEKRQVTVRRFGWSNESQEAAKSHAEGRAQEALQRAIQDTKVPRREPKVPYNGAEGLPIREEVILRDHRFAVTRNSYGALCINTPDVLFADVDLESPKDFGCLAMIVIQLAFLIAFAISRSLLIATLAGVSFWVAWIMLRSLYVKRVSNRAHYRKIALERVHKFAAAHPEWSMRIYQSPAGYRILVTHRTFDPNEPDVLAFFTAIKVDFVYQLMCRNQQCFRARLTAKPWRIGIVTHMRPRPGVWPVHPDMLPMRTAWIENYHKAAKNFAACEFIESLGPSTIDPAVQPVLEIHDRLSQATSKLPIA